MTPPSRNREVISVKVKSKRLPKAVSERLRHWFNRLFGFERFNALYRELPPCQPLALSAAILEQSAVHLQTDGEPLASVPRSGPVIFVANHPHGLVDGFALDCLLTPIRPEARLMAVYALGEIPEYRGRLVLVDPQKRRSRRRQNARGWLKAHRLLAGGGALVVFPAGGVSRFQWRRLAAEDPDWSPHIAALARRFRATVVPIYIHGRNGWPFQLIGAIAPQLQNLFIFGEFSKMRGRTLRLTVGRPMPESSWSHLPGDEATIAFFRDQTEMLNRS
jgi:putative hemolysin